MKGSVQAQVLGVRDLGVKGRHKDGLHQASLRSLTNIHCIDVKCSECSCQIVQHDWRKELLASDVVHKHRAS